MSPKPNWNTTKQRNNNNNNKDRHVPLHTLLMRRCVALFALIEELSTACDFHHKILRRIKAYELKCMLALFGFTVRRTCSKSSKQTKWQPIRACNLPCGSDTVRMGTHQSATLHLSHTLSNQALRMSATIVNNECQLRVSAASAMFECQLQASITNVSYECHPRLPAIIRMSVSDWDCLTRQYCKNKPWRHGSAAYLASSSASFCLLFADDANAMAAASASLDITANFATCTNPGGTQATNMPTTSLSCRYLSNPPSG